MNRIHAILTTDKYTKNYLGIFINNIKLDSLLADYTKAEFYEGLVPAWVSFLENTNEKKYIWSKIDSSNNTGGIVPILLCPDDLDLSCTVIVVKVKVEGEKVIWEKVGEIKNDNWDTNEWKSAGIRDMDTWSDEDWCKYGDTLGEMNLYDDELEKWIVENWNEEELRRLNNYYDKYINNEVNINWLEEIPQFVFEKEEYLICIEKFRKDIKEVDYTLKETC